MQRWWGGHGECQRCLVHRSEIASRGARELDRDGGIAAHGHPREGGRDGLMDGRRDGWMERRDAATSQAEHPPAHFSIQLWKSSKTPLPGVRKWGPMPFQLPKSMASPSRAAVICVSAGGSEGNTSSTSSANLGESTPARGGGGFGRGSGLTYPLSTSRA